MPVVWVLEENSLCHAIHCGHAKPDDSEELQETEDPLEDPQDQLFDLDADDTDVPSDNSGKKSVVHTLEDAEADEQGSEGDDIEDDDIENDGITEPLKKFGT